MLACIACAGTAGAQIDPEDSGAGSKLGLTQLSNSGQVGSVTLFKRGATSTFVVIDLASEPAGHAEPARIERGRSCATPARRGAFELAPILNGTSRTVVAAPLAKLLSGNYVVAAYAAAGGSPRRVSCGELHG